MSIETRLKPCPFCGGAARELNRFNANVITCRGCGVKVRQSEMGQGDAAEQWNKRFAPVSAELVGLSLEVRTLGSYGKAFDLPGNRRAYTYDHQPGNVEASRLGTACQQAVASSAGDYIDRGLSLLKELQALGFGVFEVDSSRWHAAPVTAQPDLALTQQTLDDVKAGIPARDAEIEALRKELETLQAEVLSMVQMLETNEWADHCGKSELGQRLEWAITALQNRIAELTKSSSQQDADKVDAERWRAYRAAIAAEDSAFLGRGESYLSSLGLRAEVLPTEGQIDAAIDAARKEHSNA